MEKRVSKLLCFAYYYDRDGGKVPQWFVTYAEAKQWLNHFTPVDCTQGIEVVPFYMDLEGIAKLLNAFI